MKRLGKMLLLGMLLFLINGCTTYNKEETSVDAAYEILEEDEIPTEMKEEMEAKKTETFRIVYETTEGTYIAVGYGEKEQEGYEIQVDSCKVSEHFVYIHTILKGPLEEEKQKRKSYPCLVIMCGETEKQVIFLN